MNTRPADILLFIREYTGEHGYAPSGDDIAERYGVHRSYAYKLLDRMEKEGLIERPRIGLRPMGRNIRLTKAAMKALREKM